jgi:hypothetical protein
VSPTTQQRDEHAQRAAEATARLRRQRERSSINEGGYTGPDIRPPRAPGQELGVDGEPRCWGKNWPPAIAAWYAQACAQGPDPPKANARDDTVSRIASGAYQSPGLGMRDLVERANQLEVETANDDETYRLDRTDGGEP